MQLREPSPDALVSFSDFLLERVGLAASMQVALVASLAVLSCAIIKEARLLCLSVPN